MNGSLVSTKRLPSLSARTMNNEEVTLCFLVPGVQAQDRRTGDRHR